MKVVLTQDVPNLGKAGEIKEITDEYARDSLLAKGLASVTFQGATIQDLQDINVKEWTELLRVLGFPTDIRIIFHDREIEDQQATILLELSLAEVELLQKINQGLPSELGQRYSALIAKRDAETLIPDEHEELINLTDQVEQLEAQRVAYLVELARLRNTTVAALIQELDIRPSVYV